jgi:hypothetical protein
MLAKDYARKLRTAFELEVVLDLISAERLEEA